MIHFSDLKPYIEIAHADPFVPNLPSAIVRKEELPDNVKRRIFVFERGSQFYLLSDNPETFMWVSPIPQNILDRHGLIQRECPDNIRIYTKADEIMSRYPAQERSLIPIIHEVQETYNYVPLELLPYIAKQHIGITETKAYSVASFYERFSFEPKGKYIIRVCDGTACHVRQSLPVLERLRSELGLSAQKHTTDDMLFTVETVSCLGACSLAPALMVNDHVHPAMTPDKATQLIADLREEAAKS